MMRLKMMNLTKMARKLYNCAKDIIFATKGINNKPKI